MVVLSRALSFILIKTISYFIQKFIQVFIIIGIIVIIINNNGKIDDHTFQESKQCKKIC